MFKPSNKQGFTFIEVCMAILILSLVFGVATYVMSYARTETQKGFWIQQSIEMLRNTTRMIGNKLKEKNYPSVLILKKKGWSIGQYEDPFIRQVVQFKEKRNYDRAGRLLSIKKNETNKSYEIYVKQGKTEPSNNEIELMHFPICTPEKIYTGTTDGTSESGTIVFHRFMFLPNSDYDITGLGRIIMEQYTVPIITTLPGGQTESYNIHFHEQDCNYYFSHIGSTNKQYKSKELIQDVSSVEINKYNLTIPKGRGVAVNGDYSDLIKFIITFKITCKCPKDQKVNLSDMTAITVVSEVLPL